MNLELVKGSRSKILAGLILGMAAIFVIRLFYLQIIEHQYYVKLAAQEQVKRLTIPAQRGEIYGMNGTQPIPLAMNQTVYTLFADPTTVNDPDQIVSVIQKVAASNAEPDLKDLLQQKDSQYEVLAKQLTNSQAQTIKSYDFSGIGFQAVSQRVYPEGTLAAQVLGFVDSNGVGQYGVEQGLNSELAGTDGLLQAVTDVSDVPLTIGNNYIDKLAKDGTNVVLTIDASVQSEAETALAAGVQSAGATNGSAIVIDPQTGKVLAMANVPSFDPSNYGAVTNYSDYSNATISDPYEPGSVIKSFTMATGINEGVVSPSSTYDDTGTINVDGTTIQNAEPDNLGTVSMQQVLTDSLNTGAVTVAERLGDGSNITQKARNTIYTYFHNLFGFGSLTGIQLAGESPGTVIAPNTVQGNAVRYSNMVFGQGMDLTMLQVVAGFSSLVNGGIYHTPTIVEGSLDSDGTLQPAAPLASHTTIKASTSATIKQMLATDRLQNGGFDIPGYANDIGGKTGTSQAIINGQYVFNQTTASYLGFGGDSTAKYVIMVQVSAPGKTFSGAQSAGPIFTNISNWMLKYLKVEPQG